eukprot:gnl/TRDRNA2_/TRDRNA2_38394_c0_seq1.p1 gnl/TRDRNA2_/TRDRNA2_38394_c0~~gnl/TRDRNA2_/TRDRNA2_38394_c0_seq1.p1  ORF type:complete len:172 (-),score=36.45 gnl/TRDRNA2_/TRDRNA2_38394_c0_seq1:154-669(-)
MMARALLAVLFPLLLQSAEGVWEDCSAAEGITAPQLTFENVSSDPEIVVYGGHQKIYKTIINHGGEIKNVTAELSQYWKGPFNYTWVRFLKINTNQCEEHPTLCPLAAKGTAHLVTQHPPIMALTPYGWYRSKQVYTDVETKKAIGCVDMQFRYCKNSTSCPYLEEQVVHV